MYDFLVVGGGVVGLSLAWELARRDRTVCLVDGGRHHRSTSWVGAGILPPPQPRALHDPLEQLRAKGHALHVEWSQRLLAETGIDNELWRCGGVYVARSPGEGTALRVSMQQLQQDGVRVERLAAADLSSLEPNLATSAESLCAAYRLPDEMQLRSPRHLRALTKACAQQQVAFCPQYEITKLRSAGDRVTAYHGDESINADQICLCGGPWTGKLLESMDVKLAVEPWRGQMILWKTEEPLVSHVINEGYRYLVPRRDGHLLAGATIEDVGFDADTTEEAISSLRRFSCDLLPALQYRSIEQAWAGLRPGTPDGRPYLGRVPGTVNLAVAAGHYRSGLHLSPATAVVMAQLLLDDTSDLDLAAFRLHR